ncbi:MAG TPA: sulfotransferase [Acetobacteraceae bacterium]|nr:sulfotransferase [Acetobacteraceae bacterium]
MAVLPTLLAAADAFAGGSGVLDRPLSAERLIGLARRRAGLHDFGATPFLEPLRRLLTACVDEGELSLVGRLAVRWDTLRFLANLLHLRAAEMRTPALLNKPIERPIFITGLPRSGTTFLHRLMLEDPVSRAPRVWQTIHPYPPHGADRSMRQVARQLRAFERLAPEFRGLHPLTAGSPQECSEIGAHVFRSLRFDTTYRIPSYRRWLDADGLGPAYHFQRRFLQHLQRDTGHGRWVLKCPDHLFALAELRAAFPDARVVFVHRDPLSVLLSVAQLTEVLRRPFTRRVDPLYIGRQESARWLDGTARMIRAAREQPFAEPICHVGYLELVTDPVATIARVYRHFGLELEAATRERVARAVAEHPDGGYRHHAYRFADHGLDEAAEREKFAAYMHFFGIDAERRRPALAPASRAA